MVHNLTGQAGLLNPSSKGGKATFNWMNSPIQRVKHFIGQAQADAHYTSDDLSHAYLSALRAGGVNLFCYSYQ